ncbi:hypothetical protein ACIPSE_46300 [Streptomyces sp. NPDC090106]|uniref:hypothetical protein n=1 Tax=Streptomyces sp. NPDC090106 TaxID=3365946 RepID=UPI0038130AAE
MEHPEEDPANRETSVNLVNDNSNKTQATGDVENDNSNESNGPYDSVVNLNSNEPEGSITNHNSNGTRGAHNVSNRNSNKNFHVSPGSAAQSSLSSAAQMRVASASVATRPPGASSATPHKADPE